MTTHSADDARGGPWLTYRYRLGGEGVVAASGTIKAPSFLQAARRLLDGRLADAVGPTPAYLRLRAAGEEEVLVRAARSHAGPGADLRLDVVPSGAFAFDERADPDPPAPAPGAA